MVLRRQRRRLLGSRGILGESRHRLGHTSLLLIPAGEGLRIFAHQMRSQALQSRVAVTHVWQQAYPKPFPGHSAELDEADGI